MNFKLLFVLGSEIQDQQSHMQFSKSIFSSTLGWQIATPKGGQLEEFEGRD